jgi:para-aminobenzoate synthetase component I
MVQNIQTSSQNRLLLHNWPDLGKLSIGAIQELDPAEFLDRPLFTLASEHDSVFFGMIPFEDHTDIHVFEGRNQEHPKIFSPSCEFLDPIQINAHASKEIYLDQVEQVKELIRRGAFYQLNLCRFFDVDLSSEQMFKLWTRKSKAFGFHWDWQDQQIVSFSPERFCKIELSQGMLETTPIKGTAWKADVQDPKNFLGGKKNHAELSMIVDLMRHDCYGICDEVWLAEKPFVLDCDPLLHLQARIQGRLKSNISLRHFRASMSPAGSVSGAPKKIVTETIRQLEQRDRGFFMGIFFIIANGVFDSSVMIRTAIKKKNSKSFEYAAGSGLTLASVAEEEYEEIKQKTSMFSNDAVFLGQDGLQSHYCK